MTPLETILAKYRSDSMTEREKGTYFEELIRTYFRYEATYADLYSHVWLYADWVKEIGGPEFGFSGKDTGIDLVAKTRGTEEYHAIQCKCYAEDYTVKKSDIDSFFTASGQKPFTLRYIVTTTNDWSENAENSLHNQTPPVRKIDLSALETSQIDWAKYQPTSAPVLKKKKKLRPHQTSAKGKVVTGLQSADRGKLIMACGTGKTFTSLKIAEEVAGKNKLVLFLVPSLNLLSQTLTEWTQESDIPLHSFAVCSDAEVGKKRNKDEDIVETFAHELRYPATTDAKRLAEEMKKRHDADHMSVVFSTYHSLDVISRAQHLYGLGDFDLVICDEAHRTTGATFDDDKESNFVRVHDAEYLRAAKRLYMTATPRIYADSAKVTAEKDNVAICSMDDEKLYGKQLHVITFSEAVQLELLTDYKVLVLTISEDHINARLQNLLKDDNNQLKVDDAARIIGCWKALAKQGITADLASDPEPMKRAVAFCQVIERQKGSGKHKVSSKQIAGMFQKVVEAYQEQEDSDISLLCEAAHVDGGMNAGQKEEKLNWLKAEPPENTCRILSNVRCLSEGVDVPALDAVLFLTPRNSQVDVVQSVGRVMRRTPDGKKKLGYVILPVVIPAGMEAHEALNDNKVYKVVWDVLQALRSHDDRFDAFVNKLDLIGKDNRKMEVIAITDKIQKKAEKSKATNNRDAGKSQHTVGEPETPYRTEVQPELQFHVGELERALYAKVVKKCGSRSHWEDWANDIAKIANTHISRITAIVSDPANTREVEAFQSFANELRDDLNDSITDAEVIEMLAQHLITKPVFDALFEDYSFASHNPVSQAMQHVLEVLQEHRLEKEADTLEKFYASVKMRAANIHDVTAKQKIVVELYDKFFRNAFPKMTERLGIVYTPVEVVDFIIHSVNDLLQQEFGQTLGSKGVHIIDPFTGTGTFITRLLQSGLISPEQLPHKYQHEIHANEIVLLAYYIAAINIEAVYHSLLKNSPQSKIQNQQSSIVNPAFTAQAAAPPHVASGYHSGSAVTATSASQTAISASQTATSASQTATSASQTATSAFQTDTSASQIATSAPQIDTSASQIATSASQIDASAFQTDTSASQTDTSASQTDTSASQTDTSALGIAIASSAMASTAPTGQAIPAQGSALGPDHKTIPSPEGAVHSYQPFQGICLTDTFRLGEEDLISSLLHNNSERRKRQQQLDVRVIMGNPPYSAGQESANDNNQNVSYPELDARIRETYVADTSGTSIKNNYDSYIRAIRWASDRIGDKGIIGFVSGSAWIERSFAQGLRKCLTEEFSSLYIIHLRGDIRKNMLSKGAAKEGGNVFDSGSMTGIAVYFLIKNPQSTDHGKIYYHDIGDDLTGAAKREKLQNWQSVQALTDQDLWRAITPDAHHDWISQRDTNFEKYPILGDKKDKNAFVLFQNYSLGANTNRDTWIYHFSSNKLSENMQRMIDTYNAELAKNIPQADATHDPQRMKWSSSLVAHFERKRKASFQEKFLIKGLYRPFTKQWLYFDPMFIHRVGQMPQIFPDSTIENLVICVSGVGAQNHFTCLLSANTPDLHFIQTGQCFPLYLYEKTETSSADGDLFASQTSAESYTRRDAITDAGLTHFQAAYPAVGEGSSITKEDLFYYIYGLLHSPEYRSRYADNLSKELPRIPAVKTYADFRAFEKAGRDLAHWHLNYETVACHPAIQVHIAPGAAEKLPAPELNRVTKMKFAKKKDPETGKSINDKTTVIYNEYITLRQIPLEAYDYIVNGKPALEWVIERQCISTDKDSGITNDANLYATETMQNPKYPLELLLRVSTVSLETNAIVANLPALNI